MENVTSVCIQFLRAECPDEFFTNVSKGFEKLLAQELDGLPWCATSWRTGLPTRLLADAYRVYGLASRLASFWCLIALALQPRRSQRTSIAETILVHAAIAVVSAHGTNDQLRSIAVRTKAFIVNRLTAKRGSRPWSTRLRLT